MNEGFMEMRKCNGSLFSIPVAGTVTVCVFYHIHERRTMSPSAINNMVSFKADYPSVRVKGNKDGETIVRVRSQGFSPEKIRLLCLNSKSLICQCAHSLSNVEMFHSCSP